MPFALETQNLHPSTLLSLQALQELADDFTVARVLDLGCGNGILAIVAAKMYPKSQIEAVDISSNAVRDTSAAAVEHGSEGRIYVHHNDAFRHLNSNFRAFKMAFDLAICNLLADILIPCAPGIKESVKFGGYAILSGILAWRALEIEALYTELGFEIVRKYEDSPWVCYTLCHKYETNAKPIVTKA